MEKANVRRRRRTFVGLARAMPAGAGAGARHHGRTGRQGMPRRGSSGIPEAADDDSFCSVSAASICLRLDHGRWERTGG